MSLGDRGNGNPSSLLLSTEDFFATAVEDAFSNRKIQTFPLTKTYLVRVLEHHIHAENFFDLPDVNTGKRHRETMAEMFLKASQAEDAVRIGLLKKLADRSLYISGFFGDSLQRKIVDIDYYADIGGTAYRALAECAREDLSVKLYKELSSRFLEFVDILDYIATRALAQEEENILRLYENYANTGSEYARDRLLEKGLIAVPMQNLKRAKKQ